MLDRCSAAPSLRTLRFPVVALVLGSALATTLVGEPAGACSPNALPLVLSTGPCGVVLPAGDTIPADTESLIFGLEPQAVNRPTDNFSDLSEQEIQDAISLRQGSEITYAC